MKELLTFLLGPFAVFTSHYHRRYFWKLDTPDANPFLYLHDLPREIVPVFAEPSMAPLPSATLVAALPAQAASSFLYSPALMLPIGMVLGAVILSLFQNLVFHPTIRTIIPDGFGFGKTSGLKGRTTILSSGLRSTPGTKDGDLHESTEQDPPLQDGWFARTEQAMDDCFLSVMQTMRETVRSVLDMGVQAIQELHTSYEVKLSMERAKSQRLMEENHQKDLDHASDMDRMSKKVEEAEQKVLDAESKQHQAEQREKSAAQEHEAQLEQVTTESNTKLGNMETQCDARIASMKETHEGEIKAKNQELEAAHGDNRNLQETIDKMASDHKSEVAEIDDARRADVIGLLADFEAELRETEVSHQGAMHRLLRRLEADNTACLARFIDEFSDKYYRVIDQGKADLKESEEKIATVTKKFAEEESGWSAAYAVEEAYRSEALTDCYEKKLAEQASMYEARLAEQATAHQRVISGLAVSHDLKIAGLKAALDCAKSNARTEDSAEGTSRGPSAQGLPQDGPSAENPLGPRADDTPESAKESSSSSSLTNPPASTDSSPSVEPSASADASTSAEPSSSVEPSASVDASTTTAPSSSTEPSTQGFPQDGHSAENPLGPKADGDIQEPATATSPDPSAGQPQDGPRAENPLDPNADGDGSAVNGSGSNDGAGGESGVVDPDNGDTPNAGVAPGKKKRRRKARGPDRRGKNPEGMLVEERPVFLQQEAARRSKNGRISFMDIDWAEVTRDLNGWNGYYLGLLIEEAKLLAAKREALAQGNPRPGLAVTLEDFRNAIPNVHQIPTAVEAASSDARPLSWDQRTRLWLSYRATDEVGQRSQDIDWDHINDMTKGFNENEVMRVINLIIERKKSQAAQAELTSPNQPHEMITQAGLESTILEHKTGLSKYESNDPAEEDDAGDHNGDPPAGNRSDNHGASNPPHPSTPWPRPNGHGFSTPPSHWPPPNGPGYHTPPPNWLPPNGSVFHTPPHYTPQPPRNGHEDSTPHQFLPRPPR